MKANHRNKNKRLQSRIANLFLKIDPWEKPYGKPNPYSYCIGCERSIIEISINDGHHKGCWVAGIQKEIKHYQGLLEIKIG